MPHTIQLHPKDARAISQGHPWVYREAVAERPKALRAGDLVELAAPGRAYIATGIADPASPIAVRVWTRDPAERVDQALIERRLREAVALRAVTAVSDRADAYCIANAEGDRLPGIVVERWADWVSVTLHTESLRPWTDRIVAAVAAAVPSRGIYLRDDLGNRLAHGRPCPEWIEVHEPTGRFLVQLTQPGKPGLFTDMREVRVALAPMLRGRRFLNLFAHTGAFSGAAAKAGATQIVSVDLSRPFLDVATRNVELNAPGYTAHETVVGDVFEALRRYGEQRRKFDVVVADPPTFSSSRASGAFTVKDHYRPLVRACLRVLEPGGVLVAATNWRGIDREAFVRLLHDAAEMERADLRVLQVGGQPADHPAPALMTDGRYLSVVFCALAPA